MIKIDHRVVPRAEDPLVPAQIPELTDILTADPQVKEILAWLPLYADSDLTHSPDRGARHRQRTDSQGHLRSGASLAPELQAPQLRRPDGVPGFQRVVWPRAGGFYRRLEHPAGQVQAGPWRDPVPGRSRGTALVHPTQAAPGGGAGGDRAGGRRRYRGGGCASGSGHQPGPVPAHRPGTLPPGLIRPAGGVGHPSAVFAGAPADILLLADHFARETAQR